MSMIAWYLKYELFQLFQVNRNQALHINVKIASIAFHISCIDLFIMLQNNKKKKKKKKKNSPMQLIGMH